MSLPQIRINRHPVGRVMFWAVEVPLRGPLVGRKRHLYRSLVEARTCAVKEAKDAFNNECTISERG